MPNWNTHRNQLMTQTLCKIRSRVRQDLGRPKSFRKNWYVFWSLWRVDGKVLHSQFSGYFIQDVNPAQYSKTAIDETSTRAGKMQFWGWICWVILEVFHPCLQCIFRVPFNGSIPSDEYLTKCVNSASARLHHQNALDDHLRISQGVMVLCVYNSGINMEPQNMKLWKMIFPLELGMMFRFQLILFQGVSSYDRSIKGKITSPPLGEHEATNHNQVGKHFEIRHFGPLPNWHRAVTRFATSKFGEKMDFCWRPKNAGSLGPWVKIGHLFHDNCQFWNANFWLEAVSVFTFQREFPWGFLRTEASYVTEGEVALKVEIEMSGH